MKVIGLMSGTSADGIDAALCEISGEPPILNAEVIGGLTTPYPSPLRGRILDACSLGQSSVNKLCLLNSELGSVLADAALDVMQQVGIKPSQVDLIASHGQTVWHDVAEDGRAWATLQIGEAAIIAEKTGITTISNFRTRDVAAGGQGAPLTSYIDWLLLRHPDRWRAVQNIGGMANVTFLPPLTDKYSLPSAFDTGPGNALIDAAITKLTNNEQTFDQDGRLAEKGEVDNVWLADLLSDPYYARKPPKTTGRESFGSQKASQYVYQGLQRGLSSPDIIATLTKLTAQSIADAYKWYSPAVIGEVLMSGGGCHNPVLMGMIRDLLKPVPVHTHEDVGIDSDFKEALVFAVLGYESWHARPGSHPVLTGVSHPVVLGQITPGQNYIDLMKRTWPGI